MDSVPFVFPADFEIFYGTVIHLKNTSVQCISDLHYENEVFEYVCYVMHKKFVLTSSLKLASPSVLDYHASDKIGLSVNTTQL